MRPKSLILLLLALGCGLVAAFGVSQVMAKRNAELAGSAGDSVAIFVAKVDIQMGDAITEAMVRQEPWPKDKVPVNCLTDWEQLAGRRTKTKVFQGSPLLDNQLLAKGAADAGAGGLIPKGFRVVSVKVDPTIGSGSIIRPSDRVDVLVYLAAKPERGVTDAVTRTVCQNVKVFAVNDVFDVSSSSPEKSIATKTISLLVTPEQAQHVTHAAEAGVIRLIMRGLDDNETVAEKSSKESEDIGEFLKQHAAPKKTESAVPAPTQPTVAVPTPPPPPETKQFTMRIISGSQMSETVMEAKAGADMNDPASWKTVSGAGEASSIPFAAPPSISPQPAAPPEPPATLPKTSKKHPRPRSGSTADRSHDTPKSDEKSKD